MRTIVIITFLLSFSFTGKAQSFCDTMLGLYFQFEYKIIDSNDYKFKFIEDTLDFYKGKDISQFVQLNLNCEDSSFYISYAHSNIFEIMEGISEDGDEIITSYTSSLEDYGAWKYNNNQNIISFKMVNSNKWYSFKEEKIRNKKDKPFLKYNDEYRELIRLIAIKK